MEAIRPVQRTLLRDRAYEVIRDAIVAGELPAHVVLDDEVFGKPADAWNRPNKFHRLLALWA